MLHHSYSLFFHIMVANPENLSVINNIQGLDNRNIIEDIIAKKTENFPELSGAVIAFAIDTEAQQINEACAYVMFDFLAINIKETATIEVNLKTIRDIQKILIPIAKQANEIYNEIYPQDLTSVSERFNKGERVTEFMENTKNQVENTYNFHDMLFLIEQRLLSAAQRVKPNTIETKPASKVEIAATPPAANTHNHTLLEERA